MRFCLREYLPSQQKKAEALDYDMELNLYDSDDYGELTFNDFSTTKIIRLIIKFGEGTLSNDELNRLSHGFSLFSKHLEWEGDYCYQYIKVSPYYGGIDTVELIPSGSERKATLKMTAPMKVKFNPNGGMFADQSAVGEDKEITFSFPINSSTTLPYIPEVSWEKHEFQGWYDLDGNEVKADTVFTVGNHIYARWTIDLDITKVWDDGDDYEGIRPESIDLILKNKGNDKEETLILYAKDGWKLQLKDVRDEPYYEFVVSEIHNNVVTGQDGPGTYADKSEGDKMKGFVITNTHTPRRTINVQKVWDDNNDKDKIRPESVEIALCIRGDEIDRITLSIENEWRGAFENVPVFEDEKEIDYTVKEIETDVLNGNNAERSYSVAITGNMNDGFIITNIHKTETTPGYEIPKTGIE